ncbi:MAG: hypothetical protein BMS9Abin07_2081 [Acidimicrobiia bacterium]|nr:MAG: hypothetical protein BMS9Abin07_2081 [Acidimicrobiia bacterium]
MPTASERSAAEAEFWRGLCHRWRPESAPDIYADLPPGEHAVVLFYDPAGDLRRRTADWGFTLSRPHLDELARFAATLAETEAGAWADDVPDLAMHAYDSRRLLLGDRIAHWAVPWLDAVGRAYPETAAKRDRDAILELGDAMRIAPALTGSEGLSVPGEDTFGPLEATEPLARHLCSLWSGRVLLDGDEGISKGPARELDAIRVAEPAFREALATRYETAARRWRVLAEAHPGSAALWRDLGNRAEHTMHILA